MSMYTLVRTMGRPIGKPSMIETLDASQVSLLQLSQLYYDIYFVIKVSIYKNDRVLRFNQLPIDAQISDKTIQQYLTELEGQTIEALDSEIPIHLRGEVYSYDVGSFPFNIKAYNSEYHPKAEIPDHDKFDLLLSLPNLNVDYAFRHSLVSINGFFHFTEKHKEGWVIKNGALTKRISKDKTHLNVLDFTQIGEVTCVPITNEMILPATEISPLSDNLYINVGQDISNKTVGYVFGGYLHLLDNTYKRVNNQIIMVDFNKLRWESLYYMMKKHLNVKLPLTDFGDDRTLAFELYHDDTIRAAFQLSQSFIVIIDNPNINIEEIVIGDVGLPKRYETAIKPIYPLRIAEGRYPAYKARKEHNKWSIAVEDNIVPLQVRYQKEHNEYKMLHDRIYPLNGEVYARAAFVRIYGDRDLKTKHIDNYLDSKVIYPHLREGETPTPLDLEPFITLDNIPYRLSTIDEFYIPAKIIEFDENGKYFDIEYKDAPFHFK